MTKFAAGHRSAWGFREIARLARRRLIIESLECRRLLTVAPLADFVPGEILVSLDGDVSTTFQRDGKGKALEAAEAKLQKFGLSHGELLTDIKGKDSGKTERLITRWQLPDDQDVAAMIQSLATQPGVAYAEPNYLWSAASIPNDTSFGELWGLNNTGLAGGTVDADIDAAEAWDLSTGSSNIIVGVVDTGVDYNHPDLAANIWSNPGEVNGLPNVDDDGNGYIDDIHGINSITGSGDPMDDNSHGTHVSGTIGAQSNNGVGVAGVNWNVSIVATKFLGANGSGSTADAIECFQYLNNLRAAGYNVVLTNNSWGGGGFSQALMDAMFGAAGSILHVAAAGNSNSNNDVTPTYPAGYELPNIVSVAATDRNDRMASFSSYGATSVDLAAPGVSILSTTPNNTYSMYNGTSMATPHVTGAAALVASLYPGMSAVQIKDALLRGTDIIGAVGNNAAKPTLSEGRLNIYQTLVNLSETDTVAPSTITDLAVISAGRTSMTLTWSASGDDDTTGAARSYDVRYSTSPITSANWDAASKAAGEPGGVTAGSTVVAKVRGLNSNTQYYFAVKALDNLGNSSAISNIVSGNTEVGVAVLADGFENGLSQWTAQAPWGITTAYKQSGTRSVTDSPSSNYANNFNGSLTSGVIDLSGYSEAGLSFWHRYDLETSFDFGYVEVTSNGGTSWVVLNSFTGSSGGFQRVDVDLSRYDGAPSLQLRFRLQTDASIRKDGWYIDDVQLAALAAPVPGFRVMLPEKRETTEDGGDTSFTVKLTTAPTADVVISVTSSDATEGTVSTSSLTFTPANWNTPQTVTVTGVDDNLVDGKVYYSVRLSSAVSADPVYHGIDPSDVSLSNLDNEQAPDRLYFTVETDQTLGTVAAANEDIVVLDTVGGLRLLFDGSDVGLAGTALAAFDVISPNEILMAFTTATTIPNVGSVDDSDIVRFTATSLGSSTAGTFSIFFDGSDVGVSSKDENIDAIHLNSDGSLLLSVGANFNSGGVSGADSDLIRFMPTRTGATTAGSFSLYFDGSDVGLTDGTEDIDAVTVGPDGELYLSTTNNFAVTGVSGADEDVFVFVPTSTGINTSGTFLSSLWFDGSLIGLSANDLRGINLPRTMMNSAATQRIAYEFRAAAPSITSSASDAGSFPTVWFSYAGAASRPAVPLVGTAAFSAEDAPKAATPILEIGPAKGAATDLALASMLMESDSWDELGKLSAAKAKAALRAM